MSKSFEANLRVNSRTIGLFLKTETFFRSDVFFLKNDYNVFVGRMVHFVRALLAACSYRVDRVSNRLAHFFALASCGHHAGGRFCFIKGDFVSSSAFTWQQKGKILT
jgi:hypothetical protein